MSRPDVSFYLAHFTSSKYPKGYKNENNPTNEYKYLSPLKRLENILQQKNKSICFTMD